MATRQKRVGSPWSRISFRGNIAAMGPNELADTEVSPGDQPTAPLGAADRVLPTRIGRFAILRKLGSGGMGVVLLAYDEELDRKVAIKLQLGVGAVETARALREAQGLARLSHSNVVQIYDVGEHAGSLYLAMEYVEGQSLDAWLRVEARDWREVVRVFRAAGRGLAAAHAAKLVHRDFKPHNAFLCAGSSRTEPLVKVFDFGLARKTEVGELELDEQLAQVAATLENDSQLTRAGAVVGTPGYMAPEQLRGLPTDARTDQFSFCVSLWQGLYGELPFERKSFVSYALAVIQNRRREPPKGSGVPRWLREIVERGLASDPAQRWPSMDALLAALDRDPTRRRWSLLAGAALLGLFAGAYAIDQNHRREVDEAALATCEAEGRAIEASWSAARADSIGAAMRATGAVDAESTWARTRSVLDDYAGEWSRLRTRACIDARVGGTRTASWHEHAQACLDDREQSFVALVEVLAAAKPEMVPHALTSALELPALAPCVGDDVVRRGLDDEASRAQTRELRARLERVIMLERTGEYQAALAEAEPLLVDTEALGGPLVPEVRMRLGLVAAQAGAFDRARPALEQAFVEAGAAGLDELAVRIAAALTQHVGVVESDIEGALRWASLGRMFIDRAGLVGGEIEAALLDSQAEVLAVGGRHDEAIVAQRRALELLEATLGPQDLRVAEAHYGLARALIGKGDTAAAEVAAKRTLAIEETKLGPDHPRVASTLNLLGVTCHEQSKPREALLWFERSLAIKEARLGADHPKLATTISNMGMMHFQLDEFEQALPLLERALAIDEATYGPESAQFAMSLLNHALVLDELGRKQEALQGHERALAIHEATLEPDHPLLANSLMAIGSLLNEFGRDAEARPVLERALAIREPLGPSAALDEIRWELGEVLVTLGEPKRGRELIEQARAGFEASGVKEHVAVVDAWLAANPEPAP
jgi:tetratricopeptide (TPR) repeat protein